MTRKIEMESWKKAIGLFLILLMGLTAAQAVSSDDINTININRASQGELTQLKGIGPVLSERIVQYREENGPFESPEEIMDVKGIGPKTWEKNKDRITVK
jgi:competence protein ComEA